jgi:flagellar biosynthesis/type III secretory pathway protein FliH
MPGVDFDNLNELQEVKSMLAERVIEWTEEWKQQGRQKGFQRGIEKGIPAREAGGRGITAAAADGATFWQRGRGVTP